MIPETLTIETTPAERDAVLKHVPLANSIAARLRFALHTRDGLEFVLTGDDIVDFGDALDKHLRRIKNKADRKLVEAVFRRMVAQFHDEILEDDFAPLHEELNFPPDMPVEVREALQNVMDTHTFSTQEELMVALQDAVVKANSAPRDFLLGLTSGEALRLVQSEWRTPGGALHLNENLTPESLAESRYCMDALRFLALIERQGGLKLTAKKNLNRESVKLLLDEGCFPCVDREELNKFCKVLNETDVRPLHMTHVMLQDSRFTRHFKGKLLLTKVGSRILKEGRAGELQCSLLESLFQRLNLGYQDRLPDYPGIQSTIAFIFYAIHLRAQQPVNCIELMDVAFMPGVREEFMVSPYFDHAHAVFYARVLYPLEAFGLIALTTVGDVYDLRRDLDTVQVAPLFNEMFQFNLKKP